MERGYFALWRKFQDHPFWKQKRVFSKAEAWIDLLWEAQHKKTDKKVMIGLKLFDCHYGQSLKSIRTWSKRWNWSKDKTVRFIKLLEEMEQIEVKNETVTTRITIVNYRKYDPRNQNSETQTGHFRDTNRTLSGREQATDNNDKNVKNDKKIIKEIITPLVDTASEDAEHIQNGEVYLESGKTYQTKKGKILSGDKLIWFEQFWEVFNYKKGKSEASDAWLEIKDLNEDLFKKIILGAQAEARVRPHMIAKKQTPKMAQGWLSGKRWEDEIDPRIGVFSDATIATMANLDGFMEENNEK